MSLVDWMVGIDKISWTLLYVPVVLCVTVCLFMLLLATIELELENEGRYDPVLASLILHCASLACPDVANFSPEAPASLPVDFRHYQSLRSTQHTAQETARQR
jgi:hypothetical protein